MSKEIKTTLLTLSVIGGVFLLQYLFFSMPKEVEVPLGFADADAGYLAERGRLIGKVNSDQPLTYDEYVLLIQMYDYEAKTRGRLILTNANLRKGGSELLKQINQVINK